MDLGVAYNIKKHKNVKYRLAINTFDAGDSVSIINYFQNESHLKYYSEMFV